MLIHFNYLQIKNDWMLFRNWWNSIKGLSSKKQALEFGKLLIPVPDVVMKQNKKDPNETRAKLRRFIISRGLVSAASVLFFYMPGLNAISGFGKRFIGKKLSRAGLGFGFQNAMGRGATSPLVALPLQILVLFLNGMFAIRGDEDDEEAEGAARDVYRFFLPFFFNIALEFFKEDGLDSKAEHVMHFTPGISEGSDLFMPAIDYMLED